MNLLQNIRYALRNLAASPGFAITAVFTLALGIGANTAIFTVANSLLLRPLPYADPDRLMLLSSSSASDRTQLSPMSWPHFTFLEQQNRSFSAIAAFTNEVFTLTGTWEAEQLPAARVSWNFFDVLGVSPALGRTFAAAEDRAGANHVALISHRLWTRRFASSRDIIGRNITLDSNSYTVIGVLPAGFMFSFLGTNIDIWAPRVFELNLATPQQVAGGAGFLTAIARLRPGVSRDQAQAEMDVLDRQYRRDNPGRPDSDPRLVMDVTNLQTQLVSGVRPTVLVLLGAVGFVLLIACANVASLLLSRALGRKKEIAIRAALGAGRLTLIGQLLTESLLLAFVAGVFGILMSLWGTKLLSTAGGSPMTGLGRIHLDLSVLAFTLLVSIASGVLFGIAPALQLANPDLNTVLRDEGRGTTGGRSRNRSRNLLVVAQVALSVVLLVGSGLLVRSFIRLRSASPGFDPKNVLTMQVSLPPMRYSTKPQMVAFYNEAIQRIRALPGVRSVAVSSALPLNPTRFAPVQVEGQPVLPLAQRPLFNIQTISPDYAAVLHVPILRGRMFNDHDDAQAPTVAVVNEVVARRFWPNENPIGKHLTLGRYPGSFEVVGVIGDMKNGRLAADPTPEAFAPFPQVPWALLNFNIRTAADPHTVISAVRSAVAGIDANQPVTNPLTMEELLAQAGDQPRFTMLLLGIFSATALILAIVGIYGVIAYSVAQRSSELGIRMALGAASADILKLIVGHGLWLAGSGIVIGLAGSLVLTRLMSSLLYRTSASDPTTFFFCAAVFAVVAMVASYLPARRATRIDPAQTLR